MADGRPSTPSFYGSSRRPANSTPIAGIPYPQEFSGGDELLQSLEILKLVHRKEKSSLKSTTGAGSSKSDTYIFSSNMFVRSNTEALNNVMHLVLEVMFPEDAQNKFKTCWPLYGDKKRESEYRKITYSWVGEITQMFPQFFEDTKPQLNYFVTPCGDRCVRFLKSVTDCALFVVAENIAAKKKKPLLMMPDSTQDSEIIEKQLLEIQICTDQYKEKCKQIERNIQDQSVFHQNSMVRRSQEEATLSEERRKTEEKVKKLIERKPDLFPSDAISLLQSESRFIGPDGQSFETAMLQPESTIQVKDKLSEGLKEVWKEKLATTRDAYEKVDVFMKQQDPLVRLLESIDENYYISMDASKYPLTVQAEGNIAADLESCFDRIVTKYEAISGLFPKGDSGFVRSEHSLENISEKVDNCVSRATETLAASALPVTREDLEFDIRVAELAIDGFDWKTLIPEKFRAATDIGGCLEWTPVKPHNFAKVTGLTPNFDCGVSLPPTRETRVNLLKESIRLSAMKDHVEVKKHDNILQKKSVIRVVNFGNSKNPHNSTPEQDRIGACQLDFDDDISVGLLEASMVQFNSSVLSEID